jgi:hypothetical protein
MDVIEQLYNDLSKIAASMEGLERRADAHKFYDILSGAIIWSDELPKSAPVSLDCLRFVLNYRTGLLIGQPEPMNKLFWEEAMRRFPKWIGFMPERVTYNPDLISYYIKERDRSLSD